MSILLPRDPEKRKRIMLTLARGYRVTYELNGESVTLVPRGENIDDQKPSSPAPSERL